jgi:hypothetical protein
MGRWAQQRRRGGGPPASSAITPNTVTLLSVRSDGTDWILTFDGPITTLFISDSVNFLVGDASFFTNQGSAGSACSGVDDNSAGYVPGLAWALTGQPDWLLTPIAGPSSGTTI